MIIMKTFTILLIFLTYLSISGFGQNYVGGEVGFTISRMANYEKINPTLQGFQENAKKPEGQRKYGFTSGGIFDLKVSEYILLETGLLYSQHGTEYTATPDSATFTENRGCIKIPAFVKRVFGNDDIYAALLTGVYAGYWLSGNYEVTNSNGEVVEEGSVFDEGYASYDYNKMELGFNAGLELGVSLKHGRIFAKGKYGYGLTKLAENDAGNSGIGNSSSSVRNRYFSTTIGFIYKIGSSRY